MNKAHNKMFHGGIQIIIIHNKILGAIKINLKININLEVVVKIIIEMMVKIIIEDNIIIKDLKIIRVSHGEIIIMIIQIMTRIK